VGTTRAEPPRLTAAATLPYGELARAAPLAVVVGALSGLISSSFYPLVPAWMQDEGIARDDHKLDSSLGKKRTGS
jgi:hypothetical protein